MKKSLLMVAMLMLVLMLAACGDDEESTDQDTEDQEDTTETEEGEGQEEDGTEEEEDATSEGDVELRVASLIPPMTEILEIAKEDLAEEGIDLEIVVLSDNVQPNEALAEEEVDANFFQHVPYMEEFNRNNDANLTPVREIYYANYGVYAENHDSMEELPEGATIAIANDVSNIDRSLQLLAMHDVIELADTDETYYTQADITENPNNYEFEEVDLLMLSRTYEDADAVVMTPAYAEPLDLTPANDALLTEGVDNEFAITFVAREDNVDSDPIQKLADAMTSERVREFLEEEYAETSIPAFD
ncbi:MetQ/NlpA family ABC transporter substrate-binding protein [Halalkalibacillus halophilus]|uniref:MetQ/NlpA family ABC transporter substrate-binding protein n=1 Tax=Halalkalibacillus halophilus TaxID=392827 RepID=UPI0003F960A2|nr:MetQ/NlpA family ABC transporter substrate-binding protein [Halalkalibacillus halophilus]